jgi:hypothetical protein
MKEEPYFKTSHLVFYALAIAISVVLWGIEYRKVGLKLVKEEFILELRLALGTFVAAIASWVLYRLVVVLIKLSKPRRAKVFISYPHEFEPTAESVAQGASDPNLTFSKISFRPRDDHNEVIDEVRKGIRSASVLLVVVANRRGFFESEIMAASVLEKPIILLAQGDSFSFPATAYNSYPVLDLSVLERTGYKSLIQLLHLAVGTKASVDLARRAASEVVDMWFFGGCLLLAVIFSSPIGSFLYVGLKAILLLSAIVFGSSGLVAKGVYLDYIPIAIFVVVIILAGFSKLFGEFLRNDRIGRVIRQDLKSRSLTNAHLRNLLAERTTGEMILDSLWEPKTIPPATHPSAGEDPTVKNSAEKSAL